jgi:dCMP deaminase
MIRLSWDHYFMQMAFHVATRSTCLRRKVGALIVLDHHIISTGYNGTPRGVPHCEERGCIRERMNIPSGERHEMCCGVHAEQNAIIQAAVHGTGILGADMYITNVPCMICSKMIVNAEIRNIHFATDYCQQDYAALTFLKDIGVGCHLLRMGDFHENR